MRLAPRAHQRAFRQLLGGIERADVFAGIFFERAPDPVDEMTAIGQKLRIAMDDLLAGGIQMGCGSAGSAAGRYAGKPGPGLLRLKQDDALRTPGGAAEWIGG